MSIGTIRVGFGMMKVAVMQLQDRDFKFLQETHRQELKMCQHRQSRADVERLAVEHIEKVTTIFLTSAILTRIANGKT